MITSKYALGSRVGDTTFSLEKTFFEAPVVFVILKNTHPGSMRIIAQILLFFISTGFSNMYTHALCSVHSFLRKLVEFLVSTKMTQKKTV